MLLKQKQVNRVLQRILTRLSISLSLPGMQYAASSAEYEVKNATNKKDFHRRGVTRVVGWKVCTRSFSHVLGHGLGRLSVENLE